jgi:hypothetical protein
MTIRENRIKIIVDEYVESVLTDSAMKKLTQQQQAAKAERKEKFRALWKQVAAMPEIEREAKFANMPFVNVNGKAFSGRNMMLLALQGGGTVFGGFRQWIEQGRAVRKGEQGKMIWVPIFHKSESEAGESGDSVESMEKRFIIGTVFDISQTEEMVQEAPILTDSRELLAA